MLMGCGSSVAATNRSSMQKPLENVATANEWARRSKAIDRIIEEDRKAIGKTMKLLLLGAGESGKSTFVKQIRLLHHNGYSDSERNVYKMVIYANLIQGVRAILEALATLGIEYKDPKREMDETLFRSQSHMVEQGNIEVTQDLADAITKLWGDPGVQQCYDRSDEYQLLDSTQ